jgi:hypothetical protein
LRKIKISDNAPFIEWVKPAFNLFTKFDEQLCAPR